ncbi:MAG TPA: hypothetical protein VMU92_04935 [Acidobacteriaceae bacterium]|nr:hypothetical protein [Acidobacteriaceae bacterium]
MNANWKALAGLILISTLTVGNAQTTTGSASNSVGKKTAHRIHRAVKRSSIEAQIEELQKDMQEQRSQINALTQQLSERNAALEKAQQAAAEAQSAAQQAQQAAQSQQAAVASSNQSVSNLQNAVADLKKSTHAQVATIKTQQTKYAKKSDLSDLAFGKVKIGGLFYGDWAYYNNTGFGPQFLTQLNQTGPGNDGFNSFDITRTYINFLYTPTDSVTLRLTPNIYRMVNGSSSAIGNGSGAQIGGSTNGNLGFRLKYAYIQLNSLFKGSSAFSKDKVRIGQTMNPLVDWEEGLYGYRFVNLTPWNYLSLSSTYTGAEINGPIMHNGKEYLDYQIGAFNTASFHSIEQNDKKQAMGRVTWYPLGTKIDRTGLGFTIFENYGYNTKTPDTKSTPLNRLAILGHYQSPKKGYELVGEYDLGRNAFSTGNMFSGAGPTSTGAYAAFNSLASAILAGDKTRQQGFAFFGHAQLGKSPFKLFGMYHYFEPNTKISGANPLNFARTVGGISYAYNKHLTFALDDQNLTYTHGQFNMTAQQIASFSPSLAETYPDGIPNVVPGSTNAIFMNMQFSY